MNFKRFIITFLAALFVLGGTVFAQSGGEARLAQPTESAAESDVSAPGSPMAQLTVWVILLTALFVVLIIVQRKLRGRGTPRLKSDAFEVLGTAPLAFRQQMYVMRCGNKVFLASLSQNGMDRIGEIDDPAEVERLTRLCHGEVLGTRPGTRAPEEKD